MVREAEQFSEQDKKKKEEAKPTPPPTPSKEVQLLAEIRDLLKK
jgi:large-conductance mechanosensitive channel